MLAKICEGIPDALGQLRGEFLAEFKYDGQRSQIHLLPNGSVKLFSRNCEAPCGPCSPCFCRSRLLQSTATTANELSLSSLSQGWCLLLHAGEDKTAAFPDVVEIVQQAAQGELLLSAGRYAAGSRQKCQTKVLALRLQAGQRSWSWTQSSWRSTGPTATGCEPSRSCLRVPGARPSCIRCCSV